MLLCLQMNFEQKREKRNGNIFVSNSAFLFSLHADISFSETCAFFFLRSMEKRSQGRNQDNERTY